MMQVNARPAMFQRGNRYTPPVPETINPSFTFAWRLDPSTTVGRTMAAANQRLRSSNSETPRLDVEILLAFVLRTDRVGLAAAASTGWIFSSRPKCWCRDRKQKSWLNMPFWRSSHWTVA